MYIGHMENIDSLPKGLLDILVCPQTKGTLTFDKQKQELISDSAKLAYPVKNGIPIMLVSEARNISA